MVRLKSTNILSVAAQTQYGRFPNLYSLWM